MLGQAVVKETLLDTAVAESLWRMRTSVQSIEHSSHLRIHVSRRGELNLKGVVVQTMFQDAVSC